jgi:hypothetical protein
MVNSGIFWSVVVGAATYLLKAYTFDPLLQFKKEKAQIAYSLKYYAGVINSDCKSEIDLKRHVAFRKMSCNLAVKYGSILFRRFLSTIKILPSLNSINDASSSLLYISNTMNGEKIPEQLNKYVEKIKHDLHIK